MNECEFEGCIENSYPGYDKCILHCEKGSDDFKDITSRNYKAFNKSIVLLGLKNNTFKEIVFPKVDITNLNNFRKEKITFDNCIFEQIVYGEKIDINVDLEFKDCKFEEPIFFEEINFKKEVSFTNSEFVNDFVCNKSTFFEIVDFNGVVFSRVTDFSETIFKENINQKHTLYKGYSTFRDVTFEKKLNLRDTIFYNKVNFLNISKNEKNEQVEVENRETARIIKDSFEQQNNVIEANKFYALEMKEREKELSWSKNFFDKLVFTIHEVSSNHSQSWTLALFWIIVLTFFSSYLITAYPKSSIIGFILKLFGSGALVVLIGCTITKLPENDEERWKVTIPIAMVSYFIYGFISGDWKLNIFSKIINPFSMMRGSDPISFGELIFKIIIAYLIYQLIISIRQNTRRK